jgi:hypothetical protein
MKIAALTFLLLITSPILSAQWTTATLIEKRTINEWCRHCPDWNKTRYSFKFDDDMTYVGEAHRNLNIAVNGHNQLRIENSGRVGDHLYVRDDSGKEWRLRIVEKIAPK